MVSLVVERERTGTGSDGGPSAIRMTELR